MENNSKPYTKHRTSIYLDNAATTFLSDSMKAYLISLLDLYGNPSSLHSIGQPVRQILSDTRHAAAQFINANTDDIYFTPSGSASNTLAIRGYCSKYDCDILYSPIAHKSILKCVESREHAHPLKVDSNGFIDLDDLKELIAVCKVNPFVIIDYANSEIGTIQDVRTIIDLVHSHNGTAYLDCTGSIAQIPINVKSLDADMIGFSAHKLGGLKGCGVLYKKSSIELEPLIYGSQEQALIGGTENVLGIASLGKALETHDYSRILPDNRDYVYNYIVNNIPDSYIVGPPIESKNRLPHNLYMCFKGVEGESLVLLLDMNNIQVSTGSACNSGTLSASPALSAVGMNKDDIHSCIRLTFNGHESRKSLDYVCDKLRECVLGLRQLNKESN